MTQAGSSKGGGVFDCVAARADLAVCGKDPSGRPGCLPRRFRPGHRQEAYKRAAHKLAEFRTQVNKQRSTPSAVKVGYAIEEWLRTSA